MYKRESCVAHFPSVKSAILITTCTKYYCGLMWANSAISCARASVLIINHKPDFGKISITGIWAIPFDRHTPPVDDITLTSYTGSTHFKWGKHKEIILKSSTPRCLDVIHAVHQKNRCMYDIVVLLLKQSNFDIQGVP